MNRTTSLATAVTLATLAGAASAQQAADINSVPTLTAHVTQVAHATEVPVEKEAAKIEGHQQRVCQDVLVDRHWTYADSQACAAITSA